MPESLPSAPDSSGYLPIEDYGLIGDMRTAALVGKNGSIDWCCMPRFDSPSIFARILDAEKGGFFQITLEAENMTTKQYYWPETNVLVTRFLAEDGIGEVRDYMPLGGRWHDAGRRQIVRTVRAVRGTASFRMTCQPAFNYARDAHEVYCTEAGARFTSADQHLALSASVELQEEGGGVMASFMLAEGEATTFVLHESKEGRCDPALSPEEAEDAFRATVRYWRAWLGQCTYTGRWREMVHRSALVLKLLTYAPTGAIVAAPTCSLPEEIGGARNWDYRYTWIRDAAFTVYAFLRIGFRDEARAFMNFLTGICKEATASDWPLQAMYSIEGRKHLTEERLDHLSGYRGSQPVRIGNGAYEQLQLDIYGELIDAIYLYDKYGVPISRGLWASVCSFVDWVCDHWREKDKGIWEVRAGRGHFTYSKLMCWVAVDRAVRLARKRSLPADVARWTACRDAIDEAIQTRGWNDERQSFTQTFDGDALDAANLMMPLARYLSPADERLHHTLDATLQSPGEGGLTAGGLVYRYHARRSREGLGGEEGTFNICTFWLAEALTRASRTDPERLEEARLLFEQMLGHANHVGLFAEETGLRGQALGNVPQALTHLALISAAYNLDRTLSGGG